MSLIDTLQASEVLKEAGFKDNQAKALIEALSPAADNIVSKTELEATSNKLKAELVIWMVGLHLASISLLVAMLG